MQIRWFSEDKTAFFVVKEIQKPFLKKAMNFVKT